MSKTKKIKKITKWISLLLLFFVTMSLTVNLFNIKTSAHDTYFLSITIDESNFRYIPVVIFEDNSFRADKHAEAQIGQFAENTVEKDTSKVKGFKVPILSDEDLSGDEDSIKDKYSKVVDDDGDGDTGLVFTFPGVHGRNFKVDKVNANSKDSEMANFMADNLVQGLNDVLSFMKNKSGGIKTVHEFERLAAELANDAYDVIQSGSAKQISIKNTTFTISKDSPEVIADKTNKNNYVKISNGTESVYAVTRINKGYQSRGDVSQAYKDALKKYQDPEYLDWRYIVLQGNYNADALSNFYANLGDIISPSAFELTLSNALASIASGLRSLLGLYEINELMLNCGSRDNNYFYGVMPKSWMNSANLLFVVCQILAFVSLGFSLVHLLFKRQLQTVNIGEKISLMEGFKDLFITAFALGSFGLIFNLLLRLNYSLVYVFNKSSIASEYIGTSSAMISGFIASILVNIIYLVISIYFNYVYILRAFTVAILYGIGPLAIFTISLGGKYKSIFSTYIKQLISNIFLQTIHAICIAFFTNVTSTSQLRTIELLVVLISFIPLTGFIKESILGLPSGLTENAANLSNLTGSIVTGMRTAVVNKTRGGNSAPGGNGNAQGGNFNNFSHKINSAMQKTPVPQKSMFNSVPNENLFANATDSEGNIVSHDKNNSNRIYSKRNEGLGYAIKAAKFAGKTATKVGDLGMAMGYAATGDRRNMENHIKGFSGTLGANNNNNNNDFDNYGVNQVFDNGMSFTSVYDADENGDFDDDKLNNTQYADNFKEMLNAWNGTGDYAAGGTKEHLRSQAINYYRHNGVERIGLREYKNKKRPQITFNKDVLKRKGNNMANISNIPKYTPPNKDTSSNENEKE